MGRLFSISWPTVQRRTIPSPFWLLVLNSNLNRIEGEMISDCREMEMEWPACLNEYEKLVLRMNTPRVVIDNAACCTATLVKVDSARNHAFLLDTVQVLTDLDLSISKAYISSDGPYFMDVFHVTDRLGRKLADQSVISYIEQSIQTLSPLTASGEFESLTALELTGIDRPGLLSEIFAVLADLKCPVAEAKVWTNNGRIASVIFVGNEFTGGFGCVEARLRHVVQGTVIISSRIKCHGDRRLHQMMFADRDYEGIKGVAVSVHNLVERGYSIVNVGCEDRPKLLFDVISTLTDMEYVVFHGNIDTDGDRANEEFYVRHTDGTPISSEAERQRVIQCLQAAIERRSYNGLRLELCTVDRQGTNVLSEVTRAFRENGLLVTGAEVSTSGETATNVFYVTDAGGQIPDASSIDAVRQRIGMQCLQVKEEKLRRNCSKDRLEEGDGEIPSRAGTGLSNLGSLVLRNLYNLGLIRSCS